MKKIILLFIAFLLFTSCKKSKNQNIEIIPKVKILKILNDFVKDNECDKCIYEIYIDKINPYHYELIIYKGQQSLTLEENNKNEQIPIPIVKLKSGVEFDVYSGIEHYFTINDSSNSFKKLKIKSINNLNSKKEVENKMWIVKDSMNVITILKNDKVYPFLPPPRGKITFLKK